MSIRRGFSLLSAFTFGFALACSYLLVGAGQSEAAGEVKLSIYGYEGTLQTSESSAATLAIQELKIGDPPFLKELSAEDYGIASSESGVLRKGSFQVHVFKLHFRSEDQATSVINMKCKRSGHRTTNPLSVEDPENCRTPEFGLYSDGTAWSGYRREKETLVLLKGAVPQEDFYHLMEKVI
jgi:hypothetical protein